MKIFKAIILENRNFNFLNKTTHNCEVWSKTIKPPRNICKRTLDNGFERDWSVGLGAMFATVTERIKKYIFLVSEVFPGKIDSVMLRVSNVL